MYINYHIKENLLGADKEQCWIIPWGCWNGMAQIQHNLFIREKMVEWLGIIFLANHLQRQQSAVETFGLLNNIG